MTVPRSTARETRNRAVILEAAKTVFARDGYEASIDLIAAEAGVARRTVFYNFESKERLLFAVIEEMSSASVPQMVLNPDKELPAALIEFAETYSAQTTSADAAMLYRILLSGAPGLVAKMKAQLDSNYGQIVKTLSEFFSARIAAGEMRVVKPDFAAEHFLSAVVGFARIQLMLGQPSVPAARKAYIRETVGEFLHGVLPVPRMDSKKRSPKRNPRSGKGRPKNVDGGKKRAALRSRAGKADA